MAKWQIDADEWYPAFSLEPRDDLGYSTPVEVDEVLVERVQSAFAEFGAVQAILRDLADS